jgi:monoamine oxidase
MWARYYHCRCDIEQEAGVDFDIAILGAGVAGLAAGRVLARSGLRIALIEARTRVGGRVFTTQVGDCAGTGAIPVELGAEFVHGLPEETWKLLREAQLDTYEIDGANLCSTNGRLQLHDEQREGGFAVLEDMTRWLAAQPPDYDIAFADYLRLAAVDSLTGARAVEYVEGFNAADSAVIGVAALAKQQQAEDEIDSDRLFRVQRGYDALPRYLAGEIETAGGTILLGSEARRIAWQRGAVTISGAHDGDTAFTLAAKRALISVPLGVLQAGTIVFAPTPAAILAHAARLKMGPVVRVTLMFSYRFWAGLATPTLSAQVQAGLGRLSFLFTHGAVPSTWWTPMPNTAAMITAWVAGPRVGVIGNALLELSLTGLAAAFDLPVTYVRKLLVSWHTHDWLADRYARGAYSYAPAGAVDASAKMTEPVDDTLYFAGEHTDTSGHWGTVHGALRSGLRAATQLQNAGN